MEDSQVTIEHLKHIFKKFVQERGWDRFTSPKDLSMDIVSEAAELMDLFLYANESEMLNKLEKEREAIENEVADITFALFNFCSTFNIDLSKAVEHKMVLNAQKHPVLQND